MHLCRNIQNKMTLLLIHSPLVQVNTPYPAIPNLTAFMEDQGYKTVQVDISIKLINKIYTQDFLRPIFTEAFEREKLSKKAAAVAMKKDAYLSCIEPVIRFLQGQEDGLAVRIASGDLLPKGLRFRNLDEEALDWAFGNNGLHDRAKHLASLFLLDLTDFISEMTSSKFGLIKYADQISLAAETFDSLAEELANENLDPIDSLMLEIFKTEMDSAMPSLVGFSIPFPGTLYSTLRMAKFVKENYPDTKVVIGGGYVSTELRQITDPRIFDFVDFMILDDGELPLLKLSQFLEGKATEEELVRTLFLNSSSTIQSPRNLDANIPFNDLPAPSFKGIDWSQYISMMDFTNPMHRLWSDGRWIKLTFAHGCYWSKCAFCDTSLDYIGRFESAKVDRVVEKIEELIAVNPVRGFHFTDEALPPQLLVQFAERLIEKNIVISFWGNIRFDPYFTAERCQILAKAGCIAISGGLEVASDRILKLINKGISIGMAAQVAQNFTSAGVMVHTYLMYGFPTQTYQETIDSLEVVRQMFEQGLIQSGFWHRFALTIHSPVGVNPKKFSVDYDMGVYNPFANNAVEYYTESDDALDYERVDAALKSSIYNYMQGVGFDIPLSRWFNDPKARTTLPRKFIAKLL